MKLKDFAIGRFRLVGLVGQKIFYVIISPHAKYYQSQIKNTEVGNFYYSQITRMFEKKPKKKLSKLENSARSHQIRKIKIFFGLSVRSHSALDAPQLPPVELKKLNYII